GQLRRQPSVDSDTVTAIPDFLQRGGQPVERAQRAADENINEHDCQTAEYSKYRSAFGKVAPDFQGLVVRVGLDYDCTAVPVADDARGFGDLRRHADEPP